MHVCYFCSDLSDLLGYWVYMVIGFIGLVVVRVNWSIYLGLLKNNNFIDVTLRGVAKLVRL